MIARAPLENSTVRRSVSGSLALLTTALLAFTSPSYADGTVSVISPSLSNNTASASLLATPTTSIQKVVNGKYAVEVDNGWVIYQGTQGQPTLNFYDEDANGNFNPSAALKLKPGSNSSLLFDAGGIAFAPCPVAAAPVRCSADAGGGPSGVGIGFGMATVGGPGGSAGGWINDSSLTAQLTNPDGNPGSIADLAVDSTNGAYAVGWNLNTTTSTTHAIVWTLDSAGQTYGPVSMTDLGTLGGTTSQALAISKNAQYVVGIANDAAGNGHAVFASVGATSWTDITTGFPAGVIKSRALAVSSTGYVAGSATVKQVVAGKKKSVDIGFVYNINTSTVTFFQETGANVVPLKALDNGNVVGNLVFLSQNSIKPDHPFLYNGSTLTDFGTMTLASTSQPAYACRVNRPNNLGELVGTCIPNSTTAYGGNGAAAFYLDTTAATPTFLDVNAAIHASTDASIPAIAPYVMNSVSSIDDEDEITLIGIKVVGGNANEASFLASKPAYN